MKSKQPDLCYSSFPRLRDEALQAFVATSAEETRRAGVKRESSISLDFFFYGYDKNMVTGLGHR